jgi:NAD(P)-dependent dehydrogenase (short-subunit alcohol dehydrogenase family)
VAAKKKTRKVGKKANVPAKARRVASRTVQRTVAVRAAAKQPARPAIFISYKHANPTTGIATKLFEALRPAANAWGADLFMDKTSVEPSDLFDSKIVAALERTTHFIALLNNTYWNSAYCQKEITRAVERFEEDRGSVRLLFVKAGNFNPDHLRLRNKLVARVGDVQFLGPFNAARQLERLEWENEARLDDQIADLIQSMEGVIQ